MLGADDSLDLQTLGARLRAGAVRPRDVVAGVLERIAARGDDKVWIRLTPRGALQARAAGLERLEPGVLPLYGVPFAIKDNIDCAGEPTTAGCPDFAYTPSESAPVVQRLLDAGAILIGKTNLDQFATGLVGTRSPYGACASVFDARYISGGSSSGSAVAVAAGLVSFALGTDTAGSGRVPAAFNNIVGLKPTRGLLSARGVVPACRSLDCVSIFALTAGDTEAVLGVAAGFDPADPFARRSVAARLLPASLAACRIGIPREEQLEFFGNREAERLFRAAVNELVGQGATPVQIDFAPFLETARLLYGGPWVAERYVAIREFFERRPEALFPVTRDIIGSAAKFAAADYFAAEYRLQALRRQVEPVWQSIDVLVTPTAGTTYTIDAVNASPISLNTNLGYYTNFMNLLDLAAIAVPAGFQADGLPFGITLAAPAFTDRALSALGAAIHARLVQRLGATRASLPAPPPPAAQERLRLPVVRLAVCGAHMSGLPLNHQLTERGGRLVRRCRTAARYRLFALNAFSPPRPGLLRTDAGGHSIDVEVWALPTETVGSFVDGIPPPLGIGTVELEDGEQVRGFLCESHAAVSAEDISALGSWRTYVDPKKS
jgi:allophanate hydrolase